MSRSFRHPHPSFQSFDEQQLCDAPSSMPFGMNALQFVQNAGGGGNAYAQMLLGPGVSGALEACFSADLSQVQFALGEGERNRRLGALGSTEGRRISLSNEVDPKRADRRSLEVLGHEFAHAIAGGGSGETELDQPGDAGEARADRAGRRFADYVLGGMVGPAPRLEAATGGRARVHRFESAEHMDAVDGTVERLVTSEESVDPETAKLLSSTVTLGNGLKLTPGQITALMGDFYGVVDCEGNLDPKASFEHLWNADREEMLELLQLIETERAGEHVSSFDWQWATIGRIFNKYDTYITLASKNEAHFSKADTEGTDNNLGAWQAFHEMALEAAASGDPAAIEQAKALEACGMHFLTDRFSAGHGFDKEEMMEASHHDDDSLMSNAHAKAAHDQLNRQGVDVRSGDGAVGGPDIWTAYGDHHWSDPANEENALHCARAVAASYGDLAAVLSGEATPEQLAADGYATLEEVPQFNAKLSKDVEEFSHALDTEIPDGDWRAAKATAGIEQTFEELKDAGKGGLAPLPTPAEASTEAEQVAAQQETSTTTQTSTGTEQVAAQQETATTAAPPSTGAADHRRTYPRRPVRRSPQQVRDQDVSPSRHPRRRRHARRNGHGRR